MARPRFTPTIEKLPSSVPFVGPEALERRIGRPLRVRIGANESAFGMSPAAARAMREAIGRIAWYGDPEGYELRAELARAHEVSLEEICLASGIDDLLGLAARLVVEPGTPVVTSLGAYPTFNYHAEGFGAALHKVPYADDHIDLDAVAEEAHRRDAPLVFFANPDNPMGTWHPAERVRAFIEALPESTLLVLDEAYIDFAPPEALLPIDTSEGRVMRLRTFSKAHGMAGARIGYCIANAELVAALGKIRHHFGVNRAAQAAALASLRDTAFIEHVVGEVQTGREEYYRLAERLGLGALESATNFVAIDLGGGGRARKVLERLLDHDVFVRMPAVAPLDRTIRVTVGTPEERALFAEALERVLATTN